MAPVSTTDRDGFKNVIGDVDVIRSKEASILSGSQDAPNYDGTDVLISNYTSPKWVGMMKNTKWVMTTFIPYMGEIDNLVKIANNGGKISATPNMPTSEFVNYLEGDNKITKKPVKLSVLGKQIKGGKYGGVKLTGVNLAMTLSGMVAKDLAKTADEAAYMTDILRVTFSENYTDFVDRVNDHNKDYTTSIILIYSNKDLGKLPGEIAYDSIMLEDGEFNGLKPKFVYWGLKSSYNGSQFQIMGSQKVNYEE
jgi:hypothetical protein